MSLWFAYMLKKSDFQLFVKSSYYQTRPSLSTFNCTLKSQFDNTLLVDLAHLCSRQCMANGVYKCVCV